MDMSEIAKKLGFSESKQLILLAAELRRRADIQFDSSIIGVGEICKAIICLEIAASRMEVIFDHQAVVKLSGLSEKAYNRSYNSMQNSIGIKNKLDTRELAIQFGCIRLIPFVQKGLALYKDRFIASLPSSRRASTDITRPVFTAAAFYLCAKRHKLKIDKSKLIELSGTSESEFSSVSASMTDLCFDDFGRTKEKKDSKEDKGNRELVDVLPEKSRVEDNGPLSDDGKEVVVFTWMRLLQCATCHDVGKRRDCSYVGTDQIKGGVSALSFKVTGSDNETAQGQQASLIVLARQFFVAMVLLDTWQYFSTDTCTTTSSCTNMCILNISV